MSSTEKVILTEGSLEDIADAIREKNGTETTYKPREMAPAIRALNTETEWGEIGGTLSDQTDLQDALDTLNADLASKADDSVVVKSVNGNLPTNGAVTVAAEDIEAEGIGDRDVSGNPIVISDAMASVAKSLSVDLEPVQDLHGYASPWVGGAGKNKLPITVDGIKVENTDGTWDGNVYTYNGISFTINTDSAGNVTSIKANGIAGSGNSILVIKTVGLDAGSYVLSGATATGSNSSYFMQARQSTAGIDIKEYGSGASISLASATSNIIFRAVIIAGYNAQNLLFKPMLRLGSETDPTFEPYSNICPIYPHTQAEVQRTGKNILPVTATSFSSNGVTWTVHSDGTISVSGTPVGNTIVQVGTAKVSPDMGNVVLSGLSETTNVTWNRIMLYMKDGSFIDVNDSTSSQNRVIDLSNYPNAVGLLPEIKRATNNVECSGTAKVMIELGTVASSEYEPYQSSSAVMPFGQDVYGCHADFVTGKCASKYGTAVLDGVNNAVANGALVSGGFYRAEWSDYRNIGKPLAKYVCDKFKTVDFSSGKEYSIFPSGTDTAVRMFIGFPSTFTSVEQCNEWLASNPLQVAYELATPIELDLTPAQLSLLEGTNILTADGTINLTYLGSMAANVQSEIDEFESGLNNVIGSIAFIENSTAKTSHAVGEYIILNGIFCKVISAISSGETLSFGTNIQPTTIGAELRAIWAQISA